MVSSSFSVIGRCVPSAINTAMSAHATPHALSRYFTSSSQTLSCRIQKRVMSERMMVTLSPGEMRAFSGLPAQPSSKMCIRDRGDAVLRHVGNMLQEAFRATDIIGRFGGDEFVVLAKGMTSYESVERKCRRIHERMAGLLADRGKTDVTCSIGAVLINEQSADYDLSLIHICPVCSRSS